MDASFSVKSHACADCGNVVASVVQKKNFIHQVLARETGIIVTYGFVR